MPAVLVTGASTGIGEACAVHLHGLGHTVFAGVRRDADAERLQMRLGDRLVPVMLDVTDQGQIDAAAATVADATGSMRLAGVVNNAGIGIGGPVEELPLDHWRHQFEVNVIGQVAVTKAVIPMLRAGAGRIVFIGSISGRIATPMMAPYSASKHAIEAIGEALRHELADWDIKVAVVEPGAIRTPIWEKGRARADDLDSFVSPEGRERYARFIDLVRRAIDAQERNGADPAIVARAVEHALFSPRPKDRYPVGTDAKVQALASRVLPDKVRDRAVRAMADRI